MTVSENAISITKLEGRGDRHSEAIQALRVEQAMFKQVAKNLSPDFFKKIDKMHDSLEVDNGKPSYRTWRAEIEYWKRSMIQDQAEKEQEADTKGKITSKRIYQILFFLGSTGISYYLGWIR